MSTNESANDRTNPVSGQSVRHGPGVTANRAFPTDAYPTSLDPFVLFERFSIEPDHGFPMHTHRGFEIVSYMIDGGMDHEDSLGVSHTAYGSDVMQITAGRGIQHSEFPADGGACNGLQLWVNLPRDEKDAEPDYADASAGDIPTEDVGSASVTTVVGNGSPIDLYTPMEYLDVHVSGTWTWPIDDEWAGFVYGIEGAGTVDGHAFGEGDVLPVTEGRDVELQSDDALRVVAVAGRPHGEPIRLRGPVVL